MTHSLKSSLRAVALSSCLAVAGIGLGCSGETEPVDSGTPVTSKLEDGKMEGGAMDSGKMEGGAMDSGKMEGMDSGKMEGGAMDSGKMEAGKMESDKMESGKMEDDKMEAGQDGSGRQALIPLRSIDRSAASAHLRAGRRATF